VIYVPAAFAENDLSRLHAFVCAHPFATLVSPDPQDPPVTHLPLLLDPARGERGTLLGHVARANPHWRSLATGSLALAIFHGPHAYVSPSWYGDHPSVPTWNYAVVHARGEARLIEDLAALEQLVARLTDTFERAREAPWRMRLPADYRSRMLGAIVGFEIEIAHIEGKFRLSQNRSAADRVRVADALAQGGAEERAVAGVMRDREKRDREA
jgi:transcriptional regulator